MHTQNMENSFNNITDQTICLINPPNVYSTEGTTLIGVPPIGLAYIASSLKAVGAKVHFIDGYGTWLGQHRREEYGGIACGVEGGSTDEIICQLPARPLFVGISCMFMHQWPLVREIVTAIHESMPDVPVLLGGEHITGAYRWILPEIPFAFAALGEGEDTAVEVFHALKHTRSLTSVTGVAFMDNGKVGTSGRRDRQRNLDQIPAPSWDLVPIARYMKRNRFQGPGRGASMPILATRGCPYRCSFCSSPDMWTTRWVAREPAQVVAEMELYRERYGANDFQFVDLTAVIRRSWIHDFCTLLKQKGWSDFTWQMPSGTRCEIIDAQLSRDMYESGCKNLVLAPESGSVHVLKRIQKKMDLSSLLRAIRGARKAGIKVECNLIIGFPDETLREIATTMIFLLRLALRGVENVSYSAYRPTPGSALAIDAIEKGNLVFNDTVYMQVMHSTNLVRVVSASNVFGDLQLSALRLAGLFLFYGSSFAFRPWRVLRLLKNLLSGRQDTRLERVILELVRRKKGTDA